MTASSIKPHLPRQWRVFGIVFGGIAAFSVVALLAFEFFFVIPIARQAAQIAQTRGLKASQQALARNPDNPVTLRGMATELSVYDHDFDGGIGHWRHAIEIEPENLNNHYWLAIILLRAGRRNEANPLFEKVASGNDMPQPFAQKNPRIGTTKPDPNAPNPTRSCKE